MSRLASNLATISDFISSVAFTVILFGILIALVRDTLPHGRLETNVIKSALFIGSLSFVVACTGWAVR